LFCGSGWLLFGRSCLFGWVEQLAFLFLGLLNKIIVITIAVIITLIVTRCLGSSSLSSNMTIDLVDFLAAGFLSKSESESPSR